MCWPACAARMVSTAMDDLPINRHAIDQLIGVVAPLADLFAAAGFQIYMVGGIVRDMFLGRHRDAPDIDLTTDARPEQTLQLVRGQADAVWEQGVRFGTVGCRVEGQVYEITTHRSETYVADSRKPVVAFSSDIVEDLSRRDFTINAMALRMPAGTLVDPYGGRRDLQERVLRTPLTPEISFGDDPLRMLRAARFVAAYDLTPEPPLEQAMRRIRGRLAVVSRERIRAELERLLAVADPRFGLQLLARTELLGEFARELAELPAAQWVATLEFVTSQRDQLGRRAALFLHTRRDEATDRLRALKYSTSEIRETVGALHAYDLAAATDCDDPVSLRRYVVGSGEASNAARALLAVTDPSQAAALMQALAVLAEQEDLDALQPVLDGDDIQRILAVPPGRVVGDALAFLTELRLTRGFIDRATAELALRDWYRNRTST